MTPPPSNGTAAVSYPTAPSAEQTLANLWTKQRHAVRRRLRPMLITALATLALAALAALFWPPTYRSTGTILIG